MELDFSGLFTGKEKENKEPETQQAPLLYRKAQKDKTIQDQASEVYRRYQDNVKAVDWIKTEILKGMQAGESIEALFLKAADAIGRLTSDSIFLQQAETNMRAVYGHGLGREGALAIEAQEVAQRLQKLTDAAGREKDQRNKESIVRAIRAHEARLAEIKKDRAKGAEKEPGPNYGNGEPTV